MAPPFTNSISSLAGTHLPSVSENTFMPVASSTYDLPAPLVQFDFHRLHYAMMRTGFHNSRRCRAQGERKLGV